MKTTQSTKAPQLYNKGSSKKDKHVDRNFTGARFQEVGFQASNAAFP